MMIKTSFIFQGVVKRVGGANILGGILCMGLPENCYSHKNTLEFLKLMLKQVSFGLTTCNFNIAE